MINSDGYNDILVTSRDKPAVIWLNVENKRFEKTVEIDCGSAFHSPVIEDIDGDGDNDIIISGFMEDPTVIWLNKTK